MSQPFDMKAVSMWQAGLQWDGTLTAKESDMDTPENAPASPLAPTVSPEVFRLLLATQGEAIRQRDDMARFLLSIHKDLEDGFPVQGKLVDFLRSRSEDHEALSASIDEANQALSRGL